MDSVKIRRAGATRAEWSVCNVRNVLRIFAGWAALIDWSRSRQDCGCWAIIQGQDGRDPAYFVSDEQPCTYNGPRADR